MKPEEIAELRAMFVFTPPQGQSWALTFEGLEARLRERNPDTFIRLDDGGRTGPRGIDYLRDHSQGRGPGRPGQPGNRGRVRTGLLAHVAKDLSIHEEALRGWVRQAEADCGGRDERLTSAE
ncbi:hypothetical protein ABZX95_36235 [Streptomyces sp. NPDC004232]|uniref:hypothetical protein n=1 Tax=Streptomyces sp. NPDC004232 TaxID=3154454 RepID=UPI001D7424C3|nr:hypothetical protein [Streptomyces sp. tea 10]